MIQRICAGVVTLMISAGAHADTWTIDPSHSRIGFRVSHMMVSSVEGQFPGVEGKLTYTVGQPKGLAVEVTVAMDTVDTQNADRDTHLKSAEFLDVEAHPTMGFVSTKVRTGKGGAFQIVGDLTLRGVTKSVVLEAKGLDRSAIDPWGKERLGASATTTINRHDFGVSWNQALDQGGLLVGDELDIRLDVEFVKVSD